MQNKNKQIYINIPVQDLGASTSFYEALGFEKQKNFSDANASGMKWSEEIYFMLLTHEFTKNFIEKKEIADTQKVADAIFALQMNSTEEVDEMVTKAKNVGARTYKSEFNEQHDFMYTTSIVDPDGHILEIFYMDDSKLLQK